MTAAILSILGSVLALVLLLCRMFSRQKAYRRKMAEKARKDLDRANNPDGNASDFLDGFGSCNRMR